MSERDAATKLRTRLDRWQAAVGTSASQTRREASERRSENPALDASAPDAAVHRATDLPGGSASSRLPVLVRSAPLQRVRPAATVSEGEPRRVRLEQTPNSRDGVVDHRVTLPRWSNDDPQYDLEWARSRANTVQNALTIGVMVVTAIVSVTVAIWVFN
jgi:hypothetical protein